MNTNAYNHMICKARTITSSKYWLWHTFSWWCYLLIMPGLKITLEDSPGIGSLQCARFDCQDLSKGNMIPCSRSIWKMGRLSNPLDNLLEWDYLPNHQLRIYHFWQAIWLIGHVFFSSGWWMFNLVPRVCPSIWLLVSFMPHMVASINGDTPKCMVYNGKSY